ncbi:monovalent cation/H(+) antiporter subunit G [Georgenia sp. MJ170]|uniref:monovalent cation/H(+) antiporter subunit G n=1 Tax=Georgenia sunbinii TaxID=3117728 RepID=UPI002F2680A0
MTAVEIADLVGAVFLLLGSMLAVVAGLGALRLPDLVSRMHAATKPQVFGLMLLMTGLALTLRSLAMTFALVLVVAFQLVTAPISAHMLSRAGYRTGKVDAELMVVDELTEDLERADKLDELDRLEAERAEQEAERRERAERTDPESAAREPGDEDDGTR